MKFRIVSEHRFWWTVTVRVPDPGKADAVLSQQFKMQFRMLPLDEATEIRDRLLAAARDDATLAAFQADTIRKVACGWDDSVVDDDEQPISFAPEALDRAVLFAPFRNAVLDAYGDAMSKGQKRGN